MTDPIAAYHALLDDERLTGDSAEALTEGQRARHLMFGERPLCVAVRPQILTRPRYEQAVTAAQGVYSALAALEKAVLKDDELRRELALEPEEESLAMADPGFRSSSSSVRLDSFFADEVRFVEYNAESPAGMAYSDNLAAIFAGLPAMKAFRKQFRGRFLPTRRSQLRSMLRAFTQWDRGAKPAMAIVDWEGLPTAPEFEMFKAFFEEAGVQTVICDPRAVRRVHRRRRLRRQQLPGQAPAQEDEPGPPLGRSLRPPVYAGPARGHPPAHTVDPPRPPRACRGDRPRSRPPRAQAERRVRRQRGGSRLDGRTGGVGGGRPGGDDPELRRPGGGRDPSRGVPGR